MKRLPKEKAMPLEDLLKGSGELLGQTGRAFDVGEKEGMKFGLGRRHWEKLSAAPMGSRWYRANEAASWVADRAVD